jgi:hypothetical protein
MGQPRGVSATQLEKPVIRPVIAALTERLLPIRHKIGFSKSSRRKWSAKDITLVLQQN